MLPGQLEESLATFFSLIFGEEEGFIEISTRVHQPKAWKQEFFKWPTELNKLLKYVLSNRYGKDVYFGTSLLRVPKRDKKNVALCTCIWADLDDTDPQSVMPRPPIVIESSPGRYQALWPLDEPATPLLAEEYAKRVAYAYTKLNGNGKREGGSDPSGWDLGQLLRVPFTRNYKPDYGDEPPDVDLITALPHKTPLALFDVLPITEKSSSIATTRMPSDAEIPHDGDADSILEDYATKLVPRFYELYEDIPSDDEDWSRLLFAMYRLAFEAGMTKEEVFAVAKEAACNKFVRDKEPMIRLWHDVLRAYEKLVPSLSSTLTDWSFPPIIAVSDTENTGLDTTFVDRYTAWGLQQSDAPAQYHEASAFLLLSAVLAPSLRIPLSIGKIIPNLWIMILADTTLTRKTTAMDMALDVLTDAFPEADDPILATDGSLEGILQGLSGRAKRTSIFRKDEVTGFVEQMAAKDYMSGMMEGFCKLYDGGNIRRQLRKETINVTTPIFLLYAAGIKNKMQSILTSEHVTSGFIPRFLVISAESRLADIKPVGRRTEESIEERKALVAHLANLREAFSDVTKSVSVGGGAIGQLSTDVDAEITDEALSRYNEVERQMLEAGLKAEMPEYYTPVFQRMAITMLKMAALLAADEQGLQEPTDGNNRATVTVDVRHINKAATYIQKWSVHMIELLGNLGMTPFERTMERCYEAIKKDPGCQRSTIMRAYKLSAMETDNILRTLEQRALIRIVKRGKGSYLWPED